MAFNGSWYIKVGDYPIPLRFMAYKTYKCSINTQDLDSYRDADGLLHRNVLPHQAAKLEFETPYMTNTDFRSLISNIRRNMTNLVARDVQLQYYDEESDSYKSGTFYMPGTMEYTLFNKNIHEPTRIAFIEY
jgi:hypothetical protein